MREQTILYNEFGLMDLNQSRILMKPVYSFSGFKLAEEYFLVIDLDGNVIKEPFIIAKTEFEYSFVEKDGFKGVKTSTSYYGNYDPNDKEAVPEAKVEELSEKYYSAVDIGNLKLEARSNQIILLKETVKGTPFEEKVTSIVGWYHNEIDLFIRFELKNFIEVLNSEIDPVKNAVLNAVPLPEVLPDVSAKSNILNRLNAYFDFIEENS